AVSNPWELATLLINGKKVERGAKPVLLRGQENEVTVENPPELVMTVRLGLPANGGLNIDASPDFKDWVAPNNGKFTWIITPEADKSGLITLVFYSREVDPVWDHRSLVISSNLGDEAEALIGGVPVPVEGSDFKVGDSWVLTLEIKPDSPLRSLPIALNCSTIEGPDLELKSEPDFLLPQTDYVWTVTGVKGDGAFRLSLHGDGMTDALDLPICRLTSARPVADYVSVQIDGKPLTSGRDAPFTSWGLHTITLMPKPGVTVPDKVKLKADRPDFLLITPGREVAQTLDPVKGATWECRCTGSGAELRSFIEASFDKLPSRPLGIMGAVTPGKYELSFFDASGQHPFPPPSSDGPLVVKAGELIGLNVRVKDLPIQNPVEGVSVVFTKPDFGDETAISNASGRASSVSGVHYSQSGRLVEIVAKTTEVTGQVSMARLQIKIS
ncbi:hypothetical protein PMI26_03981, partial [Pseudomonas sp. GM33]